MPVGGLVPDESTAFQTGPIVVLDVLYFTTYNTTYAIDASTCVLKWKYSHPGPPGGLGVNRGIAFDSGKLFRGTGDAHILALDASTGQPAWDVSIGDPKKGRIRRQVEDFFFTSPRSRRCTSGPYRWTQRQIVVWSTGKPRSAMKACGLVTHVLVPQPWIQFPALDFALSTFGAGRTCTRGSRSDGALEIGVRTGISMDRPGSACGIAKRTRRRIRKTLTLRCRSTCRK
jgi:hypothetical protein